MSQASERAAMSPGDPPPPWNLLKIVSLSSWGGGPEVHVRHTSDGSMRLLKPGDVVGEIALLDDRPRTATVRASGPGVVYRLHRDDFLAALQVSDEARERVRALSSERLERNSGPS